MTRIRLMSLIWGLVMLSGCRFRSSQPEVVPDGLVAIEENQTTGSVDAKKSVEKKVLDVNELDPRVPVNLNGPESPIAALWKAGATRFTVFDRKPGECPDEASSNACKASGEWILDRAARQVIKRTCTCGQNAEAKSILASKDFQKLEQLIASLTVIASPAVCAAGAPQVAVELVSKQGEDAVYHVNYGQCGSQNPTTPRVEVKSFENLMNALNALPL